MAKKGLDAYAKARTSNISLQISDIVSMFDINIIQSALQSLEEERAHIEEYLQNAAKKKKELDKEISCSNILR